MTNPELKRWAGPAFVAVLAAVLAGIYLSRGEPASAVGSAAVLLAYAAFLVLGRNFEPVGLLGAGQTDERREEINRRAGILGWNVVLATLACGFLWDLARGGDGLPYSALGATSGFAYLAGVLWYRRRL